MDKILETFKQEKYQKCLNLIELLPATDNLTENYIIHNCALICKSAINILEEKHDGKDKIEEELYEFFDNVTSVGSIVPLPLKLTAVFNLYCWLLFYSDRIMEKNYSEEYLSKINLGLIRVLDNKHSTASYLSPTEKIICNLYQLKELNQAKSHISIHLTAELTIVTLMCVIKIKYESLTEYAHKSAALLVEFQKRLKSLDCEDKFFMEESQHNYLFTFGLNKITNFLPNTCSSVVDYMQILESTIFFLMKNFSESLSSLKKKITSNTPPLWNYLGALNSFKLQKKKLSLEFIRNTITSNIQPHLKMRFYILHGMLCSLDSNYKEALKHFENALNISLNFPFPFFYIGQQYGKMGLYDMMLTYFEKLTVTLQNHKYEVNSIKNIEKVIFDWIHPAEEISESEALYSLAISYGLNEKYSQAADTFDKLIQSTPSVVQNICRERIIQLPHSLTVLHEASLMNLMAGNLEKSEEIASEALAHYFPQEFDERLLIKESLLNKDVNWLQKMIQEELFESDIVQNEINESVYSEEMVFIFPENLIALLIFYELQKIRGLNAYKTTLLKIFSHLSKYLVSINKKSDINESERLISSLVKVLASKVCLFIADVEMILENTVNTEKMLKRSLSCNRGNKDTIFSYCKFLLKNGNVREASKLWCTFCNERPLVSVESVSSFTLRYFLSDKVTTEQLEEIQKQLLINEI